MELLVERLQQTNAESIALWRVDDRNRTDCSYEDTSVTSVTFAELFAWTSTIRDSLQQSSLPFVVGIAFPSCSIEESAVVLACVREKQWTYVPIDVTLSLSQQLFMLQDARVNALVTLCETAIAQFLTDNTDDFLESVPRKVESNAPEVFQSLSVFSLTPSVAASEPLVQSESDSYGEAPLYILYTSGSTGHPKGVLGTRKGALNRLQWMWEQFPFSSCDERVMRVTKLSFVDSVWEILGALLMQVPLVHLQRMTASQPAASGHAILSQSKLFLHAVERHQVSRFTVVPSVLEVLLFKYSTSASSALLQRALKSVKYVLISGEVLPLSLVTKATSALPHVKLLNLYGSTEVSGDITWLEIQGSLSETELSQWSEHGVPVGKLQNRIGDTKLRLQVIGSEHIQLQPAAASFTKMSESTSVEGELLAAGSALALGYTCESSPTVDSGSGDDAMKRWTTIKGGEDDGVWFRTGDIVRVLDGCIYFCGRRDLLVKIRGQRIQLEAVERILEAALTAEYKVIANSGRELKAVVLAMKDPTSYGLTSQSLVAFLLVRGNAQSVTSSTSSSKLREYPEKARLFKWIRERFGDAYVPRDVLLVPIDSVDRLQSGKLDRAALRTLYETEIAVTEGSKQQPISQLQDGRSDTRVRQFVMAQVVKGLGIRLNDDDGSLSRTFQELGGNSLHATLLSWEMQLEFGCAVQAHEWLSATLHEIVESLEGQLRSRPHRETGADREAAMTEADSTLQVGVVALERDTPTSPSPTRKRLRHSDHHHLPETNTLPKCSFWALSRCNHTSAGRSYIPALSSYSVSLIAPFTTELAWQVDLKKCIDASPLVIRRTIANESASTPTTITSTWVAVGSHSAEFACVDIANSGRVVWKRILDDRIEASAAMSERNGTLFIGTYSGALYALEVTTGSEKWVFQASDAIKAAVLVINALQLVVCGAYDHMVYGIDAATGDKRWELEMTDNGSLFSTPVYVSGSRQLFYASTKGSVCCVALRGARHNTQPTQIWARQLPAPVFSSLNATSSTPTAVQLLLVGCADGNLYALNTGDGEIQWCVATHKPIFSSPCVYKTRYCGTEALLFGSHDGWLRKVLCEDGHVVWSTELGSPIFSSPSVFEAVAMASPVVTAPAAGIQEPETKRLMCCVATIDGSLFLCDEATGAIVTRLSSVRGPSGVEETALGELFSSPVVIDDLCLIGSRSNQLYAFRLTE